MADLDARSVGNMRQNAQNAEQTKVIRNSNNFPLDYEHPTSHRYADVDIFYHYFGERGDVVPLRTGHTVRTFTMASPNEIDIYMRKQFLHIPMKAIYPRTWDEVLYPLPVDGDSAPLDGRANFPLVAYVNKLIKFINDFEPSETTWCLYIKLFDALANVVSNGSLFAKVNQHYSSLVDVNFRSLVSSYDRFISSFYSGLSSELYGHTLNFYYLKDGVQMLYKTVFYGLKEDNVDGLPVISSWHQLHEYMKFCNYRFDCPSLGVPAIILDHEWEMVPMFSSDLESEFINIEPILAYQLCCAQFYTNDRVDNIYSANTYRNYIQSLFSDAGVDLHTFIFDDVEYIYDVFSQHNFTRLVEGIVPDLGVDNWFVLDAIDQLFSYRYSLRFGDYFLGARTRALAVGESSIPVTQDGVYVEDITRHAALQRLRYNINVLGRKINNQLIGLIPGKSPKTPDDIPTSISYQDFNIGKDSHEVSNTGAAQVSTDPQDALPITVHLNSGASDFAFKVELTEPCIILGLVSFSVPRVYSKTIDRFAFHHDRFDMFIPQMQFVGDQEIFRKELFGLTAPDRNLPFAYNQRYSEYKQRYSFASGAFCEFLKSWEMVTDNTEGNMAYFGNTIDVAFSHSSPSEFDRFYKSTLGNSLADYMHFIVKHYNTSEPVRAMAWNPEPLL